MDYQEIIISWSEKYYLKEQKDIDELQNKVITTTNTLYQLYGDSHIYGRDVLLYIGISNRAERRLTQHLKGVFGFVNNLSVSIGYLRDYNGNLEIPESILIANHKPSFNKEFIHDISPKAKENGQKIIIINNDNNLMLKTSCTNFWWVNNINH